MQFTSKHFLWRHQNPKSNAYLADADESLYERHSDRGLQVIDVSNPAHPVRVGEYDTSGYARDVAVVGNLIYLAEGEWGLAILELSRPPWLEVSGLAPFTFRVSGEPATTLRVQRSSNLQVWEDWQTVTLDDTPVQLPDPSPPPAGARYFRAVQP